MKSRLFEQLDQRLALSPLRRILRQTRPADYVPLWRAPPISPGRIALWLIGLLFVSGLGLTFFYIPTAEEASTSLAFLHESQPLGWLIHNVHRWSALLLFAFVTLHALRVWVTRAYRYPRDLSWWVGVTLLLVVIILGGTGYLLRWDIKAFALMDLVISNLSTVPLLGSFLVTLILGGSRPDVVPLNRGYALHVWFLPAALVAFVSLHLVVVWRQGLAHLSAAWERTASRLSRRRSMNLVPGLMLLLVLLLLSLITPHGGAEDPAYRSVWPHPDWLLMFYFLPFWFFESQNRIIGALILPLLILAVLLVAPRLVERLTHRVLLLALGLVGVILVFWLFGQMAAMGMEVPLQGCQACHRSTMVGDAPTRLSEFDIRDPDWLVFHLRDPQGSLLIPFSEPRKRP